MNKLFSTLFAVVFATSMLAQSGLTCNDPIPVDKSYVGKVEAGTELWYTAWSYDLPLHVYFSPDSADTDWGPEVLVDFTCVPGVYADHKLDSVLKILEAMEITMPVEFLCDEVIRNGKVEWDLSIDQKYRDQLTEYGLTHNVQAFVKVYFPYSGEISLTPDTAFQSCIENGHYTQLGDTIDIAANDTENMLVLPYSEWKNDSVRFVWIGEKPARVWVAEDECQFTPTDASVYVKAKYDIDKDTPKKLYQAEMQSAIDNWIGAGIFYAKVISDAPGKLVVERIPLGEIQGDAILLKHGQPVQLEANDDRVFCFPKTWKSTEFLASTSSSMTMHVSNTSEFESGDATVIRTYPFFIESGNRNLQLTSGDISSLAASATDDYIYVRFECNSATTLTPALWNAGKCIENTIWIPLGQTISIPASDKNVYRLIYEDIAGYDLTVTWGQKNVGVAIYVASYCNFTTTAPDKLKTINVKKNSSTTVKSTDVDSWATSLEEEGFLYLQFSASRKGNVTFISDKPATPDPIYTTISDTLCYGESYTWNGQEYGISGDYQQTLVASNGADSIVTLKLTILPEVPATTEKAEIIAGETYTWNGKEYTEAGEYTITLQDENGCDYQATLILNVLPPLSPCLQASVKLNVGDELKVNLASAFTVYAIDYNAWMQQAVTLVWTGVEPLHTFVAETCEFALVPYNRYVHAYVPVPAQGDWVLDMDALAPYVDEDGYLYVRFLTEFEGTLRVK